MTFCANGFTYCAGATLCARPRKTTEYHLTQAGKELEGVIGALLMWGVNWAFGDPSPEQLDPLLLMWWIHNRVNTAELPKKQIVVQFAFHGAQTCTYWLLLSQKEVTLCMTDPGYEIDVLVSADLATFFKLWLGRISYQEAITVYDVRVEGIPRLANAFPRWFQWSPAAPAVATARAS